MMQKHFVTFYSPGTFVAEMCTEPIDKWDVQKAVERAGRITARNGAKPYGFSFTTRGREDDELDSRVIKSSPMYFLGGKVETRAEIEARNLPEEKILRLNMRNNGFDRVITTTEGWLWTQPLRPEDVVLGADGAPR